MILLISALLLGIFGLHGWVGHDHHANHTLVNNRVSRPSYVKVSGKYTNHAFYSGAMGKRMAYKVYLPPGYNTPANHRQHYPVVYLLHGVPGAQNDWLSVGSANVWMDNLLARKKVRPMILVMPQGSVSRFASSTEYVNGPLGRWATYITRDLVRKIDSSYRTVRSKHGRAIAGLSEGAYAAMNLGLKHGNEYGVIGSFSGYFTEPSNQPAFGNNKKLAADNSPATYIPELKRPLPKIYFYVGAGDRQYAAANRKFALGLKSNGISATFHVYPGRHSWKLWRDHLPGFLIFASKNLTGG